MSEKVLIAACYILHTEEFDKRIEAIADANHRDITPDEYDAMRRNANLCAIAMATLSIERNVLVDTYDLERASRWGLDYLKSKLYGTDLYNRYRDMLAQKAARPPRDEGVSE